MLLFLSQSITVILRAWIFFYNIGQTMSQLERQLNIMDRHWFKTYKLVVIWFDLGRGRGLLSWNSTRQELALGL